MADISIKIKHNLGKAEAKSRIKKLAGTLKKAHANQITEVHESWSGDIGVYSFSALGYAVSGTIEVFDSYLLLSADVPWPASLFKGKIESLIKKEATKLLNP